MYAVTQSNGLIQSEKSAEQTQTTTDRDITVEKFCFFSLLYHELEKKTRKQKNSFHTFQQQNKVSFELVDNVLGYSLSFKVDLLKIDYNQH